MTTYNYLSEMQQLCFRATQALEVLGEKGMKDFYSKAEEGYAVECSSLGYKSASAAIEQSQINAYLQVKEYVDTKEREAAEKLREQQEAYNV